MCTVCGHYSVFCLWSLLQYSVYNNNVSVYYNSGSSTSGLHSDLYRFCYSTLGIPVLYPDSVYCLGSAMATGVSGSSGVSPRMNHSN